MEPRCSRRAGWYLNCNCGGMSIDAIVCPRVSKPHSWSDWAGCVFFLVWGGFLILRMPRSAWMVLPTVVYDVVVSITYLIRRPALRTDSRWTARVAAYVGTFLVPAYVQLAANVTPGSLSPTSLIMSKIATLVWAIGLAFVIWTIWQLRFAFSIVPQARMVQSTGPYRFVRHPIYLGYIIINSAYWMAHMHLALGIVVVAWIGITLLRIYFEEDVLRETFPEYNAYEEKVGRLWPVPR
jgi:protein-S-isoprenylcysteine O-methyltransferase Ste14